MLTRSFVRFSPPNLKAAGCDWPSAVPLGSRTAVGCGQPPTMDEVRPFISPCQARAQRHRSHAGLVRRAYGEVAAVGCSTVVLDRDSSMGLIGESVPTTSICGSSIGRLLTACQVLAPGQRGEELDDVAPCRRRLGKPREALEVNFDAVAQVGIGHEKPAVLFLLFLPPKEGSGGGRSGKL